MAGTTAEQINRFKDPSLKLIDLPVRTSYPSDPVSRWMVAGATPWNVAISLPKGDWIYVISDDDILLPHCLEKMIKYAGHNDVESVSASYCSYVDGKE
jgi:hypothetical protein